MTVSKVDGPKGGRVLGSIPEILHDALGFFLKTSLEYPSIAKIRVGWLNLYQVNDPELIKLVIQNHELFHKGFSFQTLKLLLGDGLITSDGELWKSQRLKLQPAFHRQQIAGMVELMTRIAKKSVNGLYDKSKQLPDQNLSLFFDHLSLNTVTSCLFGDPEVYENHPIYPSLQDAFLFIRNTQLTMKIHSKLPLPSTIRFKKSRRIIRDWVLSLARQRIKTGDLGNDLLGIMLAGLNDDEKGLNEDQFLNESLTIFIGGFETSSTSMAWTIWHLLRHPEVLEKLYSEIDSMEYPSFSNETYLYSVIQESLRMCPPVYIVSRRLNQDTQLGPYFFKKNDQFVILPYVVHNSPDFWENPEVFKPERFIELSKTQKQKSIFFPFGLGQRTCIGNQFATTAMTIGLFYFLKKFTIAPSVFQEETWKMTHLTLKTGKPIMANLSQRN
jgi:cytochrome P450